MSDVTIKTWVNQEANAFEDFNDYLAGLIEDGMLRGMAEFMKNKLKDSDEVSLVMPWGTYHAEVKGRGDAAVVNINWEPSKGFVKLLNDDSDGAAKFDRNYQDEFDPEYVQLMRDYVAYGLFYPNRPENKEAAAKNRGLLLDDSEVTYFLNGYALVLYNIAKDKQRDGKTYRLEIDSHFPHGSFDFEYEGDQIKVKFVAHKVFKQYLKDDAIAEKAAKVDFTAIQPGEVRREIVEPDPDLD